MKDRIMKLRKELKLNQAEFGKRISISRSAVCKIESGENAPSNQTIKLICREFNVDYIWLTTGEGEMFKDSDDTFLERIDRIMADENSLHKNIIRAAVNLDVEDLEAIERIINKLKDSFMDEEKKEES